MGYHLGYNFIKIANNSLSIPFMGYVHLVKMLGIILFYFQFPLWDTSFVLPQRGTLSLFQFPLWDTAYAKLNLISL